MGHATAVPQIGTVYLSPSGAILQPGACNQIRYLSERYACHYTYDDPLPRTLLLSFNCCLLNFIIAKCLSLEKCEMYEYH